MAAVTDVELSLLDEQDSPALFALFCAVRSGELGMEAWDPAGRDSILRMQFDAQWGSYRAAFPDADLRLISRDGAPVGWVIVDRTGLALHGIDIALIAAERSRGVGTQVIQMLQQEAAAGGRPMMITVKRLNARAQALYGRLGFSVTREDAAHVFMEWNA